MPTWETDKLVLFIAFVIPGFITLKAYELLSHSTPKESSKQIIDAVAFSCANYAVLGVPIWIVERAKLHLWNPSGYFAFYVFVVLVAPIVWAWLLNRWRRTRFAQSKLPHPVDRAWDYVFAQRIPRWVVITLKNGEKLGGRFGHRSFASSAPAPTEVYLEEAWVLNEKGGFVRKRKHSAGILVMASDIESIEFFELTYGGSNE